jgi:hypothetical protein
LKTIRAFIAWISHGEKPYPDTSKSERTLPTGWYRWICGELTVEFTGRDPINIQTELVTQLPALLLGNDAEWEDRLANQNLAGATSIQFNSENRELVVHTSIVGLPPVFCYRGPNLIAITSDVYLLSSLPGVQLKLDPAGINELGQFGHPVGLKTLFQNLNMLPAASCFRIDNNMHTALTRSWEIPESNPIAYPDFLNAQAEAFTAAVRRTRTERTFISLTGGLDTRAVFSALANDQRLVDAITMSGSRPSLDARIANRLCRAYGVQHELVIFDHHFTERLPHFVETASRLSAGVSSLGQAHEVFFYNQLGDRYISRISGTLGNQVGRGGTEGVSLRGAALTILNPRLRHDITNEHWLLGRLGGDYVSQLNVLLSDEIPFSSTANYSVGSYFAVQKSPYANRFLIETLAMRPRTGGPTPSKSALHMRLRDLKHRFIGESANVSFQRRLVNSIGGPAAYIPINWGWRPIGGISLPGLTLGIATLAGMAARVTGLEDGPLRRPLKLSGLPSLYDFNDSRRWVRDNLRPFVTDTLFSQKIREAGIFDHNALSSTLDEHYSGTRDHFKTVTFALDVALAHSNFCSPQ